MWSYFIESPSSLSSKNLRESGKQIPSVIARLHQFTFATESASWTFWLVLFCLHFHSVPIIVLFQFSFCPHSFCLFPLASFAQSIRVTFCRRLRAVSVTPSPEHAAERYAGHKIFPNSILLFSWRNGSIL